MPGERVRVWNWWSWQVVKDDTRSLMTSTGWSREGETWPAVWGSGEWSAVSRLRLGAASKWGRQVGMVDYMVRRPEGDQAVETDLGPQWYQPQPWRVRQRETQEGPARRPRRGGLRAEDARSTEAPVTSGSRGGGVSGRRRWPAGLIQPKVKCDKGSTCPMPLARRPPGP